MGGKDLELANRISKIIGHFPEAWQEYQSWLRDIVSARSDLMQRYPAWQANLIFRWRLFYFTVYVLGVSLCKELLAKSKGALKLRNGLNPAFVSEHEESAPKFPVFERFLYILQRTATLLAVAELTLCGLAALTGIMLAFYYQPAAMSAHESLTTILHDIANGGLILSLHDIAGQGLIALGLMQIVIMFLGRQFLPSWLTGWISGLFLTLSAIGLSWTAIVLGWEQTGFWRFKVELSIVGSIPWVGPMMRDILSGGSGINSLTLQHMYTLHSYVLAIAAIVLSIIHLTALIWQEQHWKPAEKRFNLIKLCGGSAPNSDAPST